MAATDVRNDQNYNGNELRNFRFEVLGSHFVSPQTGQPWYRTSDNAAYYWNGTENVPMDAKLRTGIPVGNLATFASSALAALLTDETGTGVAVFATTPTLVTPILGVATATSINKVAFTAPATSATLTLADGSTLATVGAFTSTFTFTAGTSVTFPTSGTLATTAALAGYQPLDSDLTTIAGLTATTDSFMQAKGSAWAARTIAQVKTDLGLTGTNSGDQTITLTGIVAGSGTGAITTTTGTGFDTAVRLNRLDQMAAPTSAVAMGSQRITGLATPSVGTDAATKQYVDDSIVAGTSGIDAKDAVDTVTTANLTLSGVQNINGFTGVAATTTILVKDQSTAADNGIYVMQSGAWTRRADATAGKLTKGSYVLVVTGTDAGKSYMLTTPDPITVGTTAQTWVQFNAATAFTAGNGIAISSGVISATAATVADADRAKIIVTGAGIGLGSTPGRHLTGITGDGTTTAWTINHALNSFYVMVSVEGGAIVPGIYVSSVSSVVVTIKPPLGSFEVVNVLIVGS